MPDHESYLVYFHPQSLDVLGNAIKPYLSEGPTGVHVLCIGIDTGGAFCEIRLPVANAKVGGTELMVPTSMIRMIVSNSDGNDDFGFT